MHLSASYGAGWLGGRPAVPAGKTGTVRAGGQSIAVLDRGLHCQRRQGQVAGRIFQRVTLVLPRLE